MTEAYVPTIQDRQTLRMKNSEFKVSGDGAFFTVQGEGQSIGKPAVFLRLNFCNLQCGWCDTKYTWDRNLEEFWKESKDWDYDKTRSVLEQYPTRRLVITGGEPLLQQGRINAFVERIPDWKVEIETNGTIPPSQELASRCQFNVSPKLENSDNPLQKRYKPDVLKKFNTLPSSTFKFVVQGVSDLEEVSGIVDECNLDPTKIIIMPEGKTQDDINRHALEVIDAVKAYGWRLIPRLHVMLWGEKRGT